MQVISVLRTNVEYAVFVDVLKGGVPEHSHGPIFVPKTRIKRGEYNQVLNDLPRHGARDSIIVGGPSYKISLISLEYGELFVTYHIRF